MGRRERTLLYSYPGELSLGKRLITRLHRKGRSRGIAGPVITFNNCSGPPALDSLSAVFAHSAQSCDDLPRVPLETGFHLLNHLLPIPVLTLRQSLDQDRALRERISDEILPQFARSIRIQRTQIGPLSLFGYRPEDVQDQFGDGLRTMIVGMVFLNRLTMIEVRAKLRICDKDTADFVRLVVQAFRLALDERPGHILRLFRKNGRLPIYQVKRNNHGD